MSQAEFAKILGIGPSSLCDLEKERTIPSIHRAAKIAKAIEEPEVYWIQLAVQDSIRQAGYTYKVSVA